MRINTNVSALIANHNLNKSDNALGKSMQRLASGLKLNRAEDDSAGFAIASKMHTQINSINQTGRNGNDGISVVQTAEGAVNEIESILQRIRELSVQGANGTNSDDDRAAIQKEVESLKEEIVRISEQTEFNNITLLDGSLDRRSYCSVTGAGIPTSANTSGMGEVVSFSDYVWADTYKVEVKAKAEQAKVNIGVNAGVTVTAASAGVMSINNMVINIEDGDTTAAIEAKIVAAASKIGATYDAAAGELTSGEYGSKAKIEIGFSSQAVANLFTPNTLSLQGSGKDIDADFTVPREGFAGTAKMATEGNYITVTDNSGFSMVMKVTDKGKEGIYSFEVTDIGTMPIQIGIAEGQIMDLRIQTISLETLGMTNTNCSTEDGCKQAIKDLDKAISYISSIRSSLGAYQNRLESAVSSIEVAEESVTAAVARIEDTDMAEEMTVYTQMSVLAQAGVSVLAQANERPQIVLQLLQ